MQYDVIPVVMSQNNFGTLGLPYVRSATIVADQSDYRTACGM